MNMVGTLKTINRSLGNPARMLKGVREQVEPRMRMRAFERDRRERQQKYAQAEFRFNGRQDIVADIERNGFAVIKNAVEPELLYDLKRQVESHLDQGTSLQRISKDSARQKGDRSAAKVFFDEQETRRGQDYFRSHTNYVSIANPLVSAPAAVPLAFHPLLIEIAYTYLGVVPALGGLNLRKSYSNDLPEFDTLYFHVDPNSPKFLKFFFYLNDVDINGGPFCYVRGSHRKRFRGWMSKSRWTLEEMEQHYGRENVVYLTANVGDLIVADTNGFHRGTKITGDDRTMLTLDYVVHEEFDGTQSAEQFQLPTAVYESLPPRERAVADFLHVR